MLFPDPAKVSSSHRLSEMGEYLGKHARLPWIHKRQPVAFHISKVAPRVNHTADPSRLSLRAIIWFLDGSGGESHFLDFPCKLSPVGEFKLYGSTAIYGKQMRARTIYFIHFVYHVLHGD